MATPSYLRTSLGLIKRLKLSSPSPQLSRAWISTSRPSQYTDLDRTTSKPLSPPIDAPPVPHSTVSPFHDLNPSQPSSAPATPATNTNTESDSSPSSDPLDPESDLRLPRSVQAVYLRPLKRTAKHGIPSCDLQLRSYSVRNLEFFADFCLRAAYYLKLPASGPVPLPRITERWTVPRSNFIFKKSQENFERKTLRRLIQIQDGHPETVEIWLAFIRKHQYYGVGMKANVWGHEKLGVGKTMDVSLENVKQVLDPKWAHFGRKRNLETSEKVMELLGSERFKEAALEEGKTKTKTKTKKGSSA